MLPPEDVQGLERLGRWVQVLRTRHHWSLSTLATQTGLPWVSLALLEQGMLLPAERTPEVLHQLGQAFPLQHAGPTPAGLFRTLALCLCDLRLPPEEAPATSAAHLAPTPQAPAIPPLWPGPRQTATRPPLHERLVRWISPLWHPPMAGVSVTAAAPPTQTQTFYPDEGDIQVTCTWWGAEPGQPAALRLAWRADIAQAGEFWVRFTRPEDATVVLAEVSLGSALAGEAVFAAQELGFDPTRQPWALTFLLRQPDGEESSQRVPVRPDWDALWWKAYSLLQYRYACGWQPADWEDMAQDVIVRVVKALDEGRVKEHVVKALEAGAVNEGPWVAWFSIIVRHVAIDYWRNRHHGEGTHTHEAWEPDQEEEDERQAMEDTRMLAGIDVEGLLARTPLLPHERVVLELTYWSGHTSAEVARVLGHSAATVRTWHSNALRKLRGNAQEE
jgi:RNA polymerase sigma factor (sigma-70 family)